MWPRCRRWSPMISQIWEWIQAISGASANRDVFVLSVLCQDITSTGPASSSHVLCPSSSSSSSTTKSSEASGLSYHLRQLWDYEALPQVIPHEVQNLGEEGDQLGFDSRLHRLCLSLLQHPPRLHQLLRVSLQWGGHQVTQCWLVYHISLLLGCWDKTDNTEIIWLDN